LNRSQNKIRLASVLLIVVSTVISVFAISPQLANAYSCGLRDDETYNCFAAVVWPGSVDGAEADVSIVPMTINDGDVIANYIWLKDTSGGLAPTYLWFEAGYYTYDSTGDYNYYFANEYDSKNPQITFVTPTNRIGDYNKRLHVEMRRTHGGGFWEVFLISPSTYSYTNLQSNLNPNYIIEGQRLTGSGSASANEASFINSNYYFYNNWYAQNNPGSPANGYISEPPEGWWARVPDSSTSGDWHTVYPLRSGEGQFFGVRNIESQGYNGIQAVATTNNPPSLVNAWSDIPIGVTNLAEGAPLHYIEAGPGRDCTPSSDCNFHPYSSWISDAGKYNEVVNTSFYLSPSGAYVYKVYHLYGTYWQTQVCSSVCVTLATQDLQRSSPYPNAAAGGETSDYSIPLGQSTISQAQYILGNTTTLVPFCYSRVVRHSVFWTMSGCNNFSWTVSS
jgi:hypothetical protein